MSKQNEDFRLEKEEAGKSIDWAIFRRLWKFIRPYRVLFFVSLSMLSLATVLQLLFPYFSRIAIDRFMSTDPRFLVSSVQQEGYTRVNEQTWIQQDPSGTATMEYRPGGYWLVWDGLEVPLPPSVLEQARKGDIQGINNIVLFMVLVLGGNFLSNYLQVFFSNKMGQLVILDIRNSLFSRLLRLGLRFYDRNPSGRIVTRVTNDTQNLNEFFTTAITSIIKDVLLLIGIIVFMLLISPPLTGYSMLVIPLIILATYLFRFFSRKAYRKVRVRLARINAFLAEHLSGMSVIQLFNREKAKQEEFGQTNHSYYRATLQQLTVFAVFRPLMDILFYLALTTVVWFGARDLISGVLTFGTLYAFINYIDMFFQPLRDISEKFDIVQNAFSSAEKIFKLMDEEEGLQLENPGGVEQIEQASVCFDKVCFSYDGSTPILRDVSFQIQPGEKVAVVGETGAGKTSLINILTGLYPVQSGEIRIGGVSLRDFNPSSLRKQIAVVLQDVFIFSGSVIDNIRLFEPLISREEVIEAARYVHVDHLIKRFEKGFDTLLTERASTLSAGERQLIAMARAVVNQPKILVLDEATSNIDPVTEGLIQDAMERISRNRTVITIAHRLSTIKNADRILVIHRGKVAEEGTHFDLLRQDGLYTRLYRLQYEL
ncbi:MAG TPA: ABC transporter ATP-binding protein [Thermotogota bacterium]|nr:ABC transporter ATP-binding protein [Thermotogota bacterium]HRW92021.1 ABC transporter ATP-binding protein [Thermotogota bacterium]